MDAEAFHVALEQEGISRDPKIRQYYCLSPATIRYCNVGMGCVYILFLSPSHVQNLTRLDPVDPVWPVQTL